MAISPRCCAVENVTPAGLVVVAGASAAVSDAVPFDKLFDNWHPIGVGKKHPRVEEAAA